MDIENPIIIVGSGRSGSSIFHKIMSDHPELSWLSKLCDKYPDKLGRNRFFMNLLEYPIVGAQIRNRIGPHECWFFWDYHCPGFTAPLRDLEAEDVTSAMERRVGRALSEIPTRRKNRLLLKLTGWPRMGFMRKIFDDAVFIHVIRDGRAVTNSLVNVVDWWWGWRGPQHWRWGALTPEQEEEWERHGRSFVALASIQWKILMDAMERAKGFVGGDKFLEIKYEDLCDDTPGTVHKVAEFSGLEWSREFERRVLRYSLRNSNDRYRRDMTEAQQKIMSDVLGDYLRKYGYA